MLVVREWLKDYIGDSIPDVENIEKLLTFHAFEIEGVEKVAGHDVIDVDVLPNRASDCLCHRGIARELATLMGQSLKDDPLQKDIVLKNTCDITVEIENSNACPRFTASLMTGIEVTDSPQWIQDRLEAIGQRSINNIVDATNYVMYSIGQPLHVYDADKFPQVDGQWKFLVRNAKKGEVVNLISEEGQNEDRKIELKGTELLIVDKSSDMPIGLAGVKGGSFSGVDKNTTKIIIEAAHFDAKLTRSTARMHGIVVDASKRFENECSRELPPYAQQEIISLIKDISTGNYEGTIDEYPKKKTNPEVVVRPAKANALLGIELSDDEMKSILNRSGVSVDKTAEGLVCIGPWERNDLIIEVDFIEEIGRVYGFDKIKSVIPKAMPMTKINRRHYYSEQVREMLVNLGFSEVITSSFRNKDEVILRNALASDKEYMRSNLTNNIKEVLDKNAGFTDLLGIDDIRVFEIGTVFYKIKGHVTEHVSLSLGVRTKINGYNSKDDEIVKDVFNVMEISLKSSMNYILKEGVAEINFTKMFESLPDLSEYEFVEKAEEITYKPFSLFPTMTRDISMWVTVDTDVAEVELILNDAAGKLRVRTTHIDKFTKNDRTSLAFRLVFQSIDKTLTDVQLNVIMDKVYESVSNKGWETR